MVEISGSFSEATSSAFHHLRKHITEAQVALRPFEPLLLALYEQYDANVVRTISMMGITLQEEIEESKNPLSGEIEYFLELLAELEPYPNGSDYSRGIIDVLQYVRQVLGATNAGSANDA